MGKIIQTNEKPAKKFKANKIWKVSTKIQVFKNQFDLNCEWNVIDWFSCIAVVPYNSAYICHTVAKYGMERHVSAAHTRKCFQFVVHSLYFHCNATYYVIKLENSSEIGNITNAFACYTKTIASKSFKKKNTWFSAVNTRCAKLNP